MAHGFTEYRLLSTIEPELIQEQIAFHSVLADFAEQVLIPDRVLMAPATLRPDTNPAGYRHGVESNIRMCDFFLHLCTEAAQDPLYESFIQSAIQCATDPAFPMRRPVVLFRNFAAASDATRALREHIAEACDTRDYGNLEDLAPAVRGILQDWYAAVKPTAAATA